MEISTAFYVRVLCMKNRCNYDLSRTEQKSQKSRSNAYDLFPICQESSKHFLPSRQSNIHAKQSKVTSRLIVGCYFMDYHPSSMQKIFMSAELRVFSLYLRWYFRCFNLELMKGSNVLRWVYFSRELSVLLYASLPHGESVKYNE